MNLVVSLAQMDIELGEPEQNLEKVQSFAAEAARRGTHLLLLPELWSTSYDLEHAAAHAASLDEGVFAETASLARQFGIVIAGSCLSRLEHRGVGNTLVVHSPDGSMLGAYNKIHLFGLMAEDRFLIAGKRPVLVETPWARAGLAICYDLRFPELFLQYAILGAKIILLPAEWPCPRLNHLRTLLRARAIENQYFVFACNRVGESGGQRFCGHSAIIDPWGECVIEGGTGEVLLTAEVDLEQVEEVRARMPVLADRRPGRYTN